MPKPADFYTKVPHKVQPREQYEKSQSQPQVRKATIWNAIDALCQNECLTLMDGTPDPLFLGREREVSAVLESLMKKRMRNCVLIGEAGVGKTEIAREAICQAKDEAFLSLDTAALASGCTLMGQFEEKLNGILKPISKWNLENKKRISLFVDEMHTLFNLGYNASTGSVSAGNMLKPYLSDGTITVIGATTPSEYEKSIKGDRALMRRITPIFVQEMEDEAVMAVLRGFCDNELSEAMMRKCLSASKRVPYLANPDCAIEIADRLMAKALVKKKVPDDGDLSEVLSMMLATFQPQACGNKA